jgi:aminoglycoside phosphotransferase (APT) family kinase protein
MSAAVHAIDVLDRVGHRHPLVLKQFVWDDPSEPDMAGREARVLHLVRLSAVPTPEFVAVDRNGSGSGSPSLLMTRLPGHPLLYPEDVDVWLRQLVEMLPQIHALDVRGLNLHYYRPFDVAAPAEPPPWTRHQAAWEKAIEIFKGEAPQPPTHFIHRDYHPGNVLWLRSRPTGVVDWLHGCLGSPHADLGHCRWNVWRLAGPEAADRLVAEYAALVPSAPTYHPYWDLVAALGGAADIIPGRVTAAAPDGETARRRAHRDAFVLDAVRRL